MLTGTASVPAREYDLKGIATHAGFTGVTGHPAPPQTVVVLTK